MNRYQSGMLSDLNRYSPEDVISRWNLKRICYVISLVMLLEIVNLFDSGVRSTPYLLAASCIIIASGVILLPLSLCILKRFEKISASLRHYLYLCFWIFIPTIVAFTFFIRDAEAGRPPLNLLIIVGLISMVPILKPKEIVMVFILPFISNLVVSIIVNLNVTYLLYSVIFCLAGVLITTVVHRQYIFLIRELNYRISHDSLTNMLSRQSGADRAIELLSICKRDGLHFAAVMIDIDFFKSFNDSKGHAYGDTVLKKVSASVVSSFSRESDIVFRYGGEEFCVCFQTESGNVDEMIDRLMTNIKALDIPAEKNTVSDLLTISLGVAVCGGSDKTLDEIIRVADEQLYIAKNSGRNRASVASC